MLDFNALRSATRGLTYLSVVAFAGLTFAPSAAVSAQMKRGSTIQLSSLIQQPNSSSAPVRFFTINQILAKHDGRGRSGQPVQLASLDPNSAIENVRKPPLVSSKHSDEPFGLLTFRAPEGILWSKWRKLESEIRVDEQVMSACEDDPDDCRASTRRFMKIIDDARDMPTRTKIGTINRSINLALRYVSDPRNHGVPDLWSAPLPTFTSGQGDCEDYAIAKYVALRHVGMKPADLRLLLVRDRAVGQDHAVLGVRHQGRWLVLDNRHSSLVEMADLPHFTPLFAVDHQGVKLFAASYAEVRRQPELEMEPAAAGDYW